MVPTANFTVTPNLLIVKFMDISTGTPTSWSWDFGDGSPADTNQNPTHTYSNPGNYIIKLTATNTDGSSILQREIIISTVPILPVSLRTFVNLKIPSTLNITEETKEAYIAQWQLHIQPLVEPEVSISNVFNENAYTPLANALVAYLTAYSILVDEAAKASGSNASSNISPNNSSNVKKITTGPSEVEFQDASDATSSFFGKNGDGVISNLQKEICSLSHRLNINLPMCPALPKKILIHLKAGRDNSKTINWAGYPYNYTLTI